MLTVLFIPYKYPCNCLEIFISYSIQLDIYWGIQDKPSQAFCRQNILEQYFKGHVYDSDFFYTKNKHMSKLGLSCASLRANLNLSVLVVLVGYDWFGRNGLAGLVW